MRILHTEKWNFFCEKLISRGMLPPRSSKLTLLDFFSLVVPQKPCLLDFSNIDVAILRRFFNNLIKWARTCRDSGGVQFEHLP